MVWEESCVTLISCITIFGGKKYVEKLRVIES